MEKRKKKKKRKKRKKKKEKNEITKNATEIINRIIRHRSPLVTNFVCKPCNLVGSHGSFSYERESPAICVVPSR